MQNGLERTLLHETSASVGIWISFILDEIYGLNRLITMATLEVLLHLVKL